VTASPKNVYQTFTISSKSPSRASSSHESRGYTIPSLALLSPSFKAAQESTPISREVGAQDLSIAVTEAFVQSPHCTAMTSQSTCSTDDEEDESESVDSDAQLQIQKPFANLAAALAMDEDRDPLHRPAELYSLTSRTTVSSNSMDRSGKAQCTAAESQAGNVANVAAAASRKLLHPHQRNLQLQTVASKSAFPSATSRSRADNTNAGRQALTRQSLQSPSAAVLQRVVVSQLASRNVHARPQSAQMTAASKKDSATSHGSGYHSHRHGSYQSLSRPTPMTIGQLQQARKSMHAHQHPEATTDRAIRDAPLETESEQEKEKLKAKATVKAKAKVQAKVGERQKEEERTAKEQPLGNGNSNGRGEENEKEKDDIFAARTRTPSPSRPVSAPQRSTSLRLSPPSPPSASASSQMGTNSGAAPPPSTPSVTYRLGMARDTVSAKSCHPDVHHPLAHSLVQQPPSQLLRPSTEKDEQVSASQRLALARVRKSLARQRELLDIASQRAKHHHAAKAKLNTEAVRIVNCHTQRRMQLQESMRPELGGQVQGKRLQMEQPVKYTVASAQRRDAWLNPIVDIQSGAPIHTEHTHRPHQTSRQCNICRLAQKDLPPPSPAEGNEASEGGKSTPTSSIPEEAYTAPFTSKLVQFYLNNGVPRYPKETVEARQTSALLKVVTNEAVRSLPGQKPRGSAGEETASKTSKTEHPHHPLVWRDLGEVADEASARTERELERAAELEMKAMEAVLTMNTTLGSARRLLEQEQGKVEE